VSFDRAMLISSAVLLLQSARALFWRFDREIGTSSRLHRLLFFNLVMMIFRVMGILPMYLRCGIPPPMAFKT
jgi:hypothetical protein